MGECWREADKERRAKNKALLSYLRKAGHMRCEWDPKYSEAANLFGPQTGLTPKLQISSDVTYTYFHILSQGQRHRPSCLLYLHAVLLWKRRKKKEEHWKLCRCSKKLLCQCYLCGADIQQQPRWHRWQQCHRIAWVPLWCESASLSLLCNRHLKGRYIWRVRFAYKRDISHGQETKDKTQSIFRCVVTGGVKGRGHLICS